MDQDEWIQKRKRIGLNGYEAQVYLALLDENRAPASRVVRKSGVPQRKVYGALSSLIERGFAEQVLGDVKLYRGLAPEQAFKNYQRSVERALSMSRADMNELSRSAPDSPTDDPGRLGIRLVRSGQIVGVVEDAFDTVQHELLIAVPAPMLMGPDTSKDKEMQARGVDLRYVIDESLLEHPKFGGPLLENASEIESVRFAAKVPLRFLLIDRSVVMIELAESDGSAMGLVAPNKRLAENMRVLFEGIWNGAKRFTELPEKYQNVATAQK